MKTATDIQLIHASWQEYEEQLGLVRRKVFIEEQQVPEELEWDEYDAISFHILVLDKNGQPIATGRIKPDGHIGRMAVLKSWRSQGIGSAVLQTLIKHALDQNCPEVFLHAQVDAIPFYNKHGFSVCSDEFMDAGIPHRTMKKTLVSS